MHHEEEKEMAPPKIIDTKLSLMWLLSSAAFVIVTLVGIALNFNHQSDTLSAKMDIISSGFAELKSQAKEKDAKYEAMRDANALIVRTSDAHEVRIVALERAVDRSASKGR